MKFSFRPARPEDIPILVSLEEEVERNLPSRDMFAIDGPEFYEPIIAGAGHVLLAFDESGTLAGVSVVRYPSEDDKENLGLDLGLASEELSRIRHMESIFVRADCRGSGLSVALLKKSMRLSENEGRDISSATVWPLNKASLQLFFHLGFTIRAFAYKYGGKPRFILLHTPEATCEENAVLMDADAFDEHPRLLSAGMIGTGVFQNAEGRLQIEYRYLHP